MNQTNADLSMRQIPLREASANDSPDSRETALDAITYELRRNLAESTHNLVATGRHLIRAKQLLGHGKFRTWLSENFSMSSKTANRFMSVAQLVNRFQLNDGTVAQLLNMDLKTLYELAAKSTPESVQRLMLAELAQNRDINYEMIRSYKQEDQLAGGNGGDSEFWQFTRRLQGFMSWFQAHQPTLQAPLQELDKQTRRDLADCAVRLREAQSLVEDILSGKDLQTPALDGPLSKRLTEAEAKALLRESDPDLN